VVLPLRSQQHTQHRPQKEAATVLDQQQRTHAVACIVLDNITRRTVDTLSHTPNSRLLRTTTTLGRPIQPQVGRNPSAGTTRKLSLLW
jgi:hypothetical protein